MDKNEKTVETTVFDYLRWRGDLTFAQDSFNEVDNLVLCIIAYLNFRRFPELKSREADKAVPLGDVCRPHDGGGRAARAVPQRLHPPDASGGGDPGGSGGVRMLGYESGAGRGQGRCSWTRCPS